MQHNRKPMRVSRELYASNIPECCLYQTIEDHEDCLMLCWGLIRLLEDREVMKCGGCDLNKFEVDQ